MPLDRDMAAVFARITLAHIGREYPNSPHHMWHGPGDALSPHALHPIFFGSYDWHSCVHGWWQLVRIAQLFPDLAESAEVCARAEAVLTPAAVEGERAYFARPGTGGFERPYGWAWLLALHADMEQWNGPLARILAPLAEMIAARFSAYLPKLTYPVRHGVHSNTAFALVLSHDWAERHDSALAGLIGDRAQSWFGGDRAIRPIEPSGEDFLSPTLCEALLMARLLKPEPFAHWFANFLPEIPLALLTPVTPSDRSDGRLAHLDGLNLSRAWCWRTLGSALGKAQFAEAAEVHLAAALPHLRDDYMGEHWLATFALLALNA